MSAVQTNPHATPRRLGSIAAVLAFAAALLFGTVAPAPALAAEAAQTSTGLRHYSVMCTAQLASSSNSIESSEAYRILEEAVANGVGTIDFKGKGVAESTFLQALDALEAHPEYAYISDLAWSCSAGTMIEAHITYYATADEIKQMLAELPAGIDKALTWVNAEMSDVQKAQALHDYLVRTVAYDRVVANGGAGAASSYHPYGALCAGTAVCQGYALAYQLLLEKVGIPCVYVASYSMNHGWNMVQLDGAWYHVDTTWDDPLVNGSDAGFSAEVRHTYFLKGDASMTSMGYYGWSSDYSAPSDYPLGTLPTYSGPAPVVDGGSEDAGTGSSEGAGSGDAEGTGASGGDKGDAEGSNGEGASGGSETSGAGSEGAAEADPAPAPQAQEIAFPKTSTFKVKASKLKAKAQVIAWSCAAKTKLSYAKLSGSSKLSVNAKTGRITVKKGTKKGTYKIRVKVTAAATSAYSKATLTRWLTIKVA